MTDEVKITLTLSIGFLQRREVFEIDRKDWDEMSEEDRERLIEDECQTLISNYADVGVKIEE